MNNENIYSCRYISLFRRWDHLTPVSRDLVFTYLVARGDFIENDKRYQDLLAEIKKTQQFINSISE